jgi:hypothetical protein
MKTDMKRKASVIGNFVSLLSSDITNSNPSSSDRCRRKYEIVCQTTENDLSLDGFSLSLSLSPSLCLFASLPLSLSLLN